MRTCLATLFFLCPLLICAQEHARILSQEIAYEIVDENTAYQVEKSTIRINSEKGLRYAFFQDYTDKFRKVDEVSIEIFDPAGERVKKLRKNDGHVVGFNASYEITDARILFIDPQYKNFPFTVEIYCKIKLTGFTALEPWIPRGNFNLAVDKATFKVTYADNLDLVFKDYFMEGKDETIGKIKRRTYSVGALPAVDPKIRFRDFVEMQPRVYVKPRFFQLGESKGSNQNWPAFANWFYDLNNVPFKLTANTTAFIDALPKHDKKETIRRVYEYMQDKTRYVSIQLGIGGFKSLPTEDVENYGYGDCKALTTYMKNMLTYAGISSNYVLVKAGQDQPDIMEDFPGNQFNHVYLGVPLQTDTVYLECTSQVIPSDYIGKFTDDRHVLWIDKDHKSSLIRSRVYGSDSNIKNSHITLKLDKTGNATATFKTTNRGVFFDDLQLYRLADKEMINRHNIRKFVYGDFSIKEFKFDTPDRSTPVLNEQYSLEIVALARSAGDKLIIPQMPAVPARSYVDSDDYMQYYSIRRAFTLSDNIDISLPENYWIYKLPDPQVISSPFGTYELKMSHENGILRISRKMILHKGEYIKGAKFDEFKAFFDTINSIENKKLVLNSKT